MNAGEEVAAALLEMPVAWLHMPALAASTAALPQAKDWAPQPKIAPLVAAAIGVAAGAGIQLTSQALRKSPPAFTKDNWGLTCTLTVKELEVNAIKVLEESNAAKGGGPLQAIVDTSAKSKALPIAAAAFLAGVAAGAAAARP